MKDRKQITKIAKALFNNALKAQTVEKIGVDLYTCTDILRQNQDIRHFLKDIFHPMERRLEILNKIADRAQFDPISTAYLNQLLELHQLDWLPMINDYYQHLSDEYRCREQATVSTPLPLSGDDKEQLVETLSQVTGKEIVLKEEIDPSLIAGIHVQIGSLVLDGSLKNQLRRLQKEIVHAAR
ncbi:ATP synthase F1 subunit delta [bacterium]|nr:ATP synthase F1 subunit delta [bacterium]